MKIIRGFLLLIFTCLLGGNLKAQDIFYGEVGATAGCGFVLGDNNGVLFRQVQPLGGVFLKYKFNGRYEVRLQIDGGTLGITKIDGKNLNTDYFGAQALCEFNFFNYGVKRWEPYRTWASPAIMAGLGVICFRGHVAPTLPMGIGAKFKLSNRVNIGAFWIVSKVFSDELDYVNDPAGLNGAFWNNRDWYSTAQIYLSINFYKLCVPCRNGQKARKKSKY